jgi:hypothetical protein
MRLIPLIILCLVLVAAVHLDQSGTHIIPVLLGMALAQGSVLVVAAAELSNARWLKPVQRPLLAFAPLLFLFPFLVKLGPYRWLEHPNRWLRPDFFIVRNVAALAVVAVVGAIYARISRAGRPSGRKWAVAYILTFVVAQTMVAVDWTMSLDYPWFSTMYPALYLVECFYAGLVLVGIICFARERHRPGSNGTVVYDGASLFFGFALFWGGLTFAQYLTIWYGNIPEEVRYFTLRFGLPSGTRLFAATVALLFAVPFCVLLVHRARQSAPACFFLAHLVLVGLFLSRLFQVFPYINLNPGLLAIQLAAMLGIVALVVRHGVQAE